jgi:hypothetical protein
MLSCKLNKLFEVFDRKSHQPASHDTFRPGLENLEDRTVPSTVVADFPGQGLYAYNTVTQYWHHINGYDASAMAVDSSTGNVVATFPGFGTALWKSNINGWQLLTGADASILSIASAGKQIVGEFPGYGVWDFRTNTGWVQLTGADASSLATDDVRNVVGAFPGHGVWFFTALTNTWTQITAAEASQVVFCDVGFVMGEFPGHGVWTSHYGASWHQETTVDATALGGSSNGGMAVGSYYGYGTYAYNVNTDAWYLISTSPNYGIATDGADFAGVFAGDLGLVTSYFGAGTGTWQDFDMSGASLIGVSAI